MKKRSERSEEKRKGWDLDDGNGVVGSGVIGDAENWGVVDFGDWLYGRGSPWNVLCK